jgi:hypothetical protein
MCFVLTLLGVLAGTVLVASAYHIAQLVIGRLVLGVGVGFATQATPLYLSEMAPYNLRGGLNILFQLAVTIGELRHEHAGDSCACLRISACMFAPVLAHMWPDSGCAIEHGVCGRACTCACTFAHMLAAGKASWPITCFACMSGEQHGLHACHV